MCALLATCQTLSAADGNLDPSWGTAGARVFDRASLSDRPAAAVALANGGLILAGTCDVDRSGSPWLTSMCAAKLDPHGAPVSFAGASGVPVVYSTVAGFPARTFGNSASLLRDGSVVIAGNVSQEPGTGIPTAAFVIRVTDGGILDLDGTASGSGYSSFSFAPGRAASLNSIADTAVTRRGDIIAVGYVVAGDSIDELANTNFGVARIRPDLQLDDTFGTNGAVEVAIDMVEGGFEQAHAVSIDPRERIVVVGTASYAAQSSAIAVVRLHPDGSVDLGFGGGDGRVTLATTVGTQVSGFGVAHDVEGRIYVCGATYAMTKSGVRGAIALARLLDDGEPDTDFGIGSPYPGLVIDAVGFAGPESQDACSGVAIQRDGKPLMAGGAEVDLPTGAYDGAPITMRRSLDGTRDGDYGQDGIALAYMNPDVGGLRSESLNSIAADRRGGAFFVAGSSRATPYVPGQNAYAFAAARVLNGEVSESPLLADSFE